MLPEPLISREPTGFAGLDRMWGGLPKGAVTDITGPSLGKTMLALQLMQKWTGEGKSVLYLDVENSLSRELAGKFSLLQENFLLARPQTMEETIELLQTGYRTSVDFIVIDTLSALFPEEENFARSLRILFGYIPRRTQTTLLTLSQQRINPQPRAPWGRGYRPGETSLERNAQANITLSPNGRIERLSQEAGARIRFNWSEGLSQNQATLGLYYQRGFSRELSLLEESLSAGLIKRQGSYYYYHNLNLGQGSEAAANALKDPALFSQVYNELLNH